MTDSLSGRVALVTGGSGGIGAAICRTLGAHGVGVAVGYGSNREAAQEVVDQLTGDGVRAEAFGADLSDPDAPAELVAEVERSLGAVDILLANHGRGRQAAYEQVDAEEFDRTLAINLRAPFLLAQAVLGGMRERRFGRIVFVSSVAALTGGVVGPHYAASKAGLHGLTHFLAGRTAGDGVTVNAVAPGLIETSMLPGEPAQLRSRVPVGRLGRPEEVAELVLATLANGYMTNQVLGLDGGMYPR